MLPWQGLLAVALALALWMGLTRGGRQAASVTWVGVGTLRQRLGASSVVVIGIAGVVGVLVALLAMAEGYRHTLASSGSQDMSMKASRVRLGIVAWPVPCRKAAVVIIPARVKTSTRTSRIRVAVVRSLVPIRDAAPFEGSRGRAGMAMVSTPARSPAG